MSASREKKNRQSKTESGFVDPKVTRAAAEKSAQRRSNILYALFAVAFVLFAAALFIWNSGALQKNKTAVTIDGEEFKVNDVAYFFGSVYNTYAPNLTSYGLDTSKSLREQEYTEGQTWFDYFLDLALVQMKGSVCMAHRAAEEGFTAVEEQDAAEEAVLNMLDTYAKSYGNGATSKAIMKSLFGQYATKKDLIRNVRMAALADAYSTAHKEALDITDAQIDAAYAESPEQYDSVSIEYILFNSDLGSDADDAAKSAALSANKEMAVQALAHFAEGESLETVAAELGGTYQSMKDSTYSAYSDLLTWAFDSTRKTGDTSVIDYGSTGAYAVVFNSRSRSDYHAVNVRHILVEDEATADNVLSLYESNPTEDNFASLAAQYTTDTGSQSNGGLYENVRLGQMVPEFEAWCFDASRESGDTGIVQTDYGYHVMYFVSADELPYWKSAIIKDLEDADFEQWYNEITEGVTAEQGEGMQYIG